MMKFIRLENGEIFRTSVHGDIIPDGYNEWVIKGNNIEIIIPMSLPDHAKRADLALNFAMDLER